MANLLGQDIGLNYKGIVTIGSTINQNVSASLQSLTDGDGNNLPLQLATGLVGIEGGTINFTTGTNIRNVLSQTYTINNTGGTNTVTGIYLNAIQTSITGTTHNLMDLQVSGVSAFKVQNAIAGIGVTTSGSWVAYNNTTTQLVGIQGGVFYVANPTSRFQIALATGEARLVGNLFVGSVLVAPTARLHVRGDGTNPIVRFENSTGTETLGLSNTGQVLTFNSNTVSTTLIVQSSHYPSIRIVGYGTFVIGTNAVSGTPLSISNLAGSIVYAGFGSTNGTEHYGQSIAMPFSASFGSTNFSGLSLVNTINQTGGANGITRGLFINPTLTSAADFRAIETVNGNIIFGNLPTNSAGLPSGALWNNGGVVNIVP